HLRRAIVYDADRLGACLDAAYAQFAARIGDLPDMSADCAGQISENDVWVAESGDAIVGALVLAPGDDFMLLVNVAVHPRHRGEGIGGRLLMLAESETRGHGFSKMRLSTHAQMPETIGLYARNGWVEIRRQGNKVEMKKQLSG
ncbi:MAG: GNAT family N-acetyltransferase, partial [Rhizobiales bacterium]|nr:GNAT family N-acetyltransferase [Hyphomicrobiales bacterium]